MNCSQKYTIPHKRPPCTQKYHRKVNEYKKNLKVKIVFSLIQNTSLFSVFIKSLDIFHKSHKYK
jgi:hypothetical protein